MGRNDYFYCSCPLTVVTAALSTVGRHSVLTMEMNRRSILEQWRCCTHLDRRPTVTSGKSFSFSIPQFLCLQNEQLDEKLTILSQHVKLNMPIRAEDTEATPWV